MFNTEFKTGLSNTTQNVIKVAAVIGAITIIAGGYTWYLNNIWKPKVKVVSVDLNNGIAVLDYYGKEITIKGDAVYWLNADWGVRFGNIRTDSQQFKYDRLELLKKGMVVEYLQ